MKSLIESQQHIVIRLRLIQARERAKWSQGAVAKILGIHRPTISWIESGKQRLTVDLLLAFCELYQVDPAQVLRRGYDV